MEKKKSMKGMETNLGQDPLKKYKDEAKFKNFIGTKI